MFDAAYSYVTLTGATTIVVSASGHYASAIGWR
jgi:hypothetical protein